MIPLSKSFTGVEPLNGLCLGGWRIPSMRPRRGGAPRHACRGEIEGLALLSVRQPSPEEILSSGQQKMAARRSQSGVDARIRLEPDWKNVPQ